MNITRGIVICVVALAFASTRVLGQTSISIVETADGISDPSAIAASADGAVIVGNGENADGNAEGWIYDPAHGARLLAPGPGLGTPSGISADGTVVTGRSGNTAFVWTQVTGALPIGIGFGDFGNVAAVDSDGQAIIWGFDIDPMAYRAFSWTPSSGYQASFAFWRPIDISNDGMTVLFTNSTNGHALIWRSETDGQRTVSDATGGGLSGDGRVVVGGFDGVWFRWDSDCGMVSLPTTAGAISSGGRAASFDGWAVVGTIRPSTGDQQPAIWTPAGGPRLIADILTDADVDLSEWDRLSEAVDVSDDGWTVIGNGQGIQPNAGTHPWIVTLPHVPPCLKGDVTIDGVIGLDDVSTMVGVLLDPCEFDLSVRCAADVNGDNHINGGDLPAFIDLLLDTQ